MQCIKTTTYKNANGIRANLHPEFSVVVAAAVVDTLLYALVAANVAKILFKFD